MKLKRQSIFCVIPALLCGCMSVDTRWEQASSLNTIPAYEEFIKRYPGSEYEQKAMENIEAIYWQRAAFQNSIEGLEGYLSKYPNAKHSLDAKARIETILWEKAKNKNTSSAYNWFIMWHPDSKYVPKAKEKLELIAWKQAVSQNAIFSLENYLYNYPNGKHASEARTRIEALEWREVKYKNKASEYESFLHEYPNGPYSHQARSILKTFTNIEASMPETISGKNLKNGEWYVVGGWRYDFTVTFTEKRGISAIIEKIRIHYTDKEGSRWYSSPYSYSYAIKTNVIIKGRGNNSYSNWISGTKDPDLRGGAVIINYSGHDANGHAFSGSASSKLGWFKVRFPK